jgi:phosphoribosylformylglycinamidine synthase subunit PurQ / glutaminase
MARFAVVQFPGTNCERETARVLRTVLGQEVEVLWHADEAPLDEFGCVVLPGGFAYGDHLRAGAIARFSPVMRSVERYAQSGGLVLGICNGFQVLLEAGLLPGAMVRNASLQFRSEWVRCRVERTDTPFTCAYQPGQVISLPIAHGEGNYTLASQADLDDVDARQGAIFRYCDVRGETTAAANPNGSTANIAGVISESGTVLGLMPHPERASEALLGCDDGRALFESVIRWIESSGQAHSSRNAGHDRALAGVTAL